MSYNQVPLEVERVTQQIQQQPPGAPKIHYSKWHLIWSSNFRPKIGEDVSELVNQMDTIFVKTMNGQPQNFVKFRIPGTKIYKINPDEWNIDSIKKYKIKFVVEKGTDPRGGRIHIHCILWIVHNTYIQLDAKALRTLLCDTLTKLNPKVKGCFLKIKWVPSDSPLENYIGKSPFDGTGIEQKDKDII